MTEDRKERMSFACYLVASICFFVLAVVELMSGANGWLAIGYLCIGASDLCLAVTRVPGRKGDEGGR